MSTESVSSYSAVLLGVNKNINDKQLSSADVSIISK
jgi:hypothetical protein